MSTRWLLFLCFLFLSFRPFTWCWPRVLVYFFSFSYLRDPYTTILIPSSLNFTRSPMSIASPLLILPFLFFFFPSSLYKMLTRDPDVICSIHNMQQCVRQQNLFFLPFLNGFQIFFISVHVMYPWGKEITL